MTEATCKSLRTIWPIVAPALGEAISSFIKAELEMPTVARIFRAHGAEIGRVETEHMQQLLSAESAMIKSAPADILILGRQSWVYPREPESSWVPSSLRPLSMLSPGRHASPATLSRNAGGWWPKPLRSMSQRASHCTRTRRRQRPRGDELELLRQSANLSLR